MPPVNRNKPARAESSDSRCAIMEFMREFPDDAACLKWLWRNRYAPDGVHAYCPRCEANQPFKRYSPEHDMAECKISYFFSGEYRMLQ